MSEPDNLPETTRNIPSLPSVHCHVHCKLHKNSKDPAAAACRTAGAAPVQHKIFVHSFAKSATTQLALYLSTLGYSTSGWMGRGMSLFKWGSRIAAANAGYDRACVPSPSRESRGCDERCIAERCDEWISNGTSLGSFVRFAEPFDAFHDSPFGHIIDSELREGLDIRIKARLWPLAKFIFSDRAANVSTLSYFRWRHGGEVGLQSWRNVSEHRREGELTVMRRAIATQRERILELKSRQPWRVLLLRWNWATDKLADGAEAELASFLVGEQCVGPLARVGVRLGSAPTNGFKQIEAPTTEPARR